MQDSRSPQSRGSESLWPEALPGTCLLALLVGKTHRAWGAASHRAFESSVSTGTRPPELGLSIANTGTLCPQSIQCWGKVSGSPGEQPFPVTRCLMLFRGSQQLTSKTLTGEQEVSTHRYARHLSLAHHPSHNIKVLQSRVLGLPQQVEIDQRPDKKFRRGCMGAPAAAEESENKQQVSLLAHRLRRGG